MSGEARGEPSPRVEKDFDIDSVVVRYGQVLNRFGLEIRRQAQL